MPIFEKLASNHEKTSFSCGIEILDTYLQKIASQDMKRNIANTTVLAENNTILGFYTIAPFALKMTDLPEALAKKYPRDMLISCWIIGRLARNIKYKNTGIGEQLLMHALKKLKRLSQEAGGSLVVVDAKYTEVQSFYIKYGFNPIPNDEGRLYLITASIPD